MDGINIPLYEGQAPYAGSGTDDVRPSVDVYLAPPECNTGKAMLALPGGAYRFLSPLSGADYGRFFSRRGITVISVNFRLGPQGFDGRAFCMDAFAAADLALRRAAEWNLDPDELGVIGTSAGGHLAGMLATGAATAFLEPDVDSPWRSRLSIDWRPSFIIYCYAVLSLEPPLWHGETAQHFLGAQVLDPQAQQRCSPLRHIDRHHGRAFLWHTAQDTEVSLTHTLDAYGKLRAAGVPAELHAYAKGPHALGLAQDLKDGSSLYWADEAVRWIRDEPVEPMVPVYLTPPVA